MTAQSVVALCAACLLASCRATTAAPRSPAPSLPPDVYALTPNDMRAWCKMVAPDELCDEYRAVPIDVIVRFDRRLLEVLAAHGYEDAPPENKSYVRKYWATYDEGRLLIHGQVLCSDLVYDDDLVFSDDPPPNWDPDFDLRVPTSADDVYRSCYIHLHFTAASPEDVEVY